MWVYLIVQQLKTTRYESNYITQINQGSSRTCDISVCVVHVTSHFVRSRQEDLESRYLPPKYHFRCPRPWSVGPKGRRWRIHPLDPVLRIREIRYKKNSPFTCIIVMTRVRHTIHNWHQHHFSDFDTVYVPLVNYSHLLIVVHRSRLPARFNYWHDLSRLIGQIFPSSNGTSHVTEF